MNEKASDELLGYKDKLTTTNQRTTRYLHTVSQIVPRSSFKVDSSIGDPFLEARFTAEVVLRKSQRGGHAVRVLNVAYPVFGRSRLVIEGMRSAVMRLS